MNPRARRVGAAFALALVAGATPLWSARQLPMVDLPQHLHLISVLHRLDDPTTLYPRVFKVTGTVAFLGYALALLQNSIWQRRPWVVTLKACFDGLIYAALTAGTFGWLWPR